LKRLLKVISFLFLYLLILGVVFVVRIGPYVDSLRKPKEVVLLQDLWTMRRAIDLYWQDKERPPQSLQELVNASYLPEIPADPITGSRQTWVVEKDSQPLGQQSQSGIVDVHSGAAGADANGKAYN
jgi:general secretion pathway protein G